MAETMGRSRNVRMAAAAKLFPWPERQPSRLVSQERRERIAEEPR